MCCIANIALLPEATVTGHVQADSCVLLAGTLGADLTGLLEQLSQGERGEYLFDFQSPSSSGFNIFIFVVSCP